MVVGDIEDDDIFEKKSDEDEDVWVKTAYFGNKK